MDKITGHSLPNYRSPVIQSLGIQAGIKSPGIYHPVNYSQVLVSGHCDGLLVTPTGQQLRLLVSDHCVTLLVTSTGQQLRILVSIHYVELLVTSPSNSYEY